MKFEISFSYENTIILCRLNSKTRAGEAKSYTTDKKFQTKFFQWNALIYIPTREREREMEVSCDKNSV